MNAPGFSFQGGKCGLQRWICGYVPRQGDIYIEPFAGRGNVFWLACQLCKFDHWWLNDIKMAPFYKALAEVDVSKIPRCLTMADRDWLNEGRAKGDPLALVLEPIWARSGGCMPGRYTRQWDGVNGNGGGVTYARFVQRVKSAKYLLAKYKPLITAHDYTELPWDDFDDGCFAYVDPPYCAANNIRSYKPLDDYQPLLDILTRTRCRWLLSEHDQPGYRETFGPPIATKVTRAGSGHLRPQRLECLYASPNMRAT
jgi:site-specific DNA-adenine methylase